MSEQLDAINTILMALDLQPVSTLVTGHPVQAQAIRLLERKKTEVCSRKWWFNVEHEVQLVRDGDNRVAIPSTVSRLEDTTYLMKSGYLYDPEEKSSYFTEDPDEVTLVYNLAWDELPETAFSYIEALATEQAIRKLGDNLKTAGARDDMIRALAALQQEDLQHKDVNIESNPVVAKWRTKMIQR